jgi:hypothetical protein
MPYICRRRRDHDALSDSASHHSIQVWPSALSSTGGRQYNAVAEGCYSGPAAGGSSSQSTSLRSSKSSNSASMETVGGQSYGNSNGGGGGDVATMTSSSCGSTSQTPSCRALAGSLASFDVSAANTEGE